MYLPCAQRLQSDKRLLSRQVMHIAAVTAITTQLLPALKHLHVGSLAFVHTKPRGGSARSLADPTRLFAITLS